LKHEPAGHAPNQQLIVEHRPVQDCLEATIVGNGKLLAFLLLVGTTHP
jgi:hypothetical protein